MYEIEVTFEELNKYRLIRGSDPYVVQQKANAQLDAWHEMWERKQAAEQKRFEREEKAENRVQAQIETELAEAALMELEEILIATLSVNDVVDFKRLEDKSVFSEKMPEQPSVQPIPKEPFKKDAKYQAKLDFFDRFLTKRRQDKLDRAENRFQTDLKNWDSEKNKIHIYNADSKEKYQAALKKWVDKKARFEERQKEQNKRLREIEANYRLGQDSAIIDYCDLVLSSSKYPDYFTQQWDIDYSSVNKILIVDYSLPDISDLPKVKSVKYVAGSDSFSETYISEAALNKLFDSVIYQITLRTIHELFEADVINALHAIAFNGWVKSINKATGNEATTCILSVQASKDEFMAFDLSRVDPKACFKELRGVGSSKLHGLTPVAPLMNINKEDRRFVSAYDVADTLETEYNLAAMDWQDFENLIREIFQKEFSVSGGEVKITQASRDGGVDAVAFDPDPIRGGKIVIQAKRYTNVVGVSAVRDLYGTTMNEGASKGILVTTSDFGPDAYEFIKGKPLTLISGSNLLHLLEKHGHKARIDLREAKKILNDRHN